VTVENQGAVVADKTLVHTTGTRKSPLALSGGIVSGGFVFVSGAVAFSPEDGSIVGDDVAEQTRQTMSNIETVLTGAGLDFDDVVQARAYLTDVKRDFSAFDAAYREFLAEPFPARTTIGVELAVPGLLVEIDVVARCRD